MFSLTNIVCFQCCTSVHAVICRHSRHDDNGRALRRSISQAKSQKKSKLGCDKGNRIAVSTLCTSSQLAAFYYLSTVQPQIASRILISNGPFASPEGDSNSTMSRRPRFLCLSACSLLLSLSRSCQTDYAQYVVP